MPCGCCAVIAGSRTAKSQANAIARRSFITIGACTGGAMSRRGHLFRVLEYAAHGPIKLRSDPVRRVHDRYGRAHAKRRRRGILPGAFEHIRCDAYFAQRARVLLDDKEAWLLTTKDMVNPPDTAAKVTRPVTP